MKEGKREIITLFLQKSSSKVHNITYTKALEALTKIIFDSRQLGADKFYSKNATYNSPFYVIWPRFWPLPLARCAWTQINCVDLERIMTNQWASSMWLMFISIILLCHRQDSHLSFKQPVVMILHWRLQLSIVTGWVWQVADSLMCIVCHNLYLISMSFVKIS